MNCKMATPLPFFFGIDGPSKPVSSVVNIAQTAYIRYSSKEFLSIDDLYLIAYSIRDFITLGVDRSVFLSNVILHSPETQNCLLYKGCRVFQKDVNFKEKPSKIRRDDMLFDYQIIKDEFPKIMNNWVEIYSENADVMGLYFLVQSGNALDEEMEFLNYAKGLESLHRNMFQSETYIPEDEYAELMNKIIEVCPSDHHDWINSRLKFANEPTFSKRVKELVKKYPGHLGNLKQRKYLSENIFNCRNLLTHQGKNGVKQSLKGQSMTDLTKTTRLLHQLLFMSLIQISKEKINMIIKRNNYCQLVIRESLPVIRLVSGNSKGDS